MKNRTSVKYSEKQRSAKERATGSEHENSKSKIITKCAETRAKARNPETLSRQWSIDLYVFEIILKFISKSKIITKCAETRAKARNPETLSRQWSIDLYVFEIILKFIETIYVISLKDIYRLCEQSYKCCHVE